MIEYGARVTDRRKLKYLENSCLKTTIIIIIIIIIVVVERGGEGITAGLQDGHI